MYATIKRGASSDGYFAVPLEGSSFFIPPSLFFEWHLHEGQELDEEQFLHYQALQRQWACYEKGLSLLAMREHTRQELRFKLIQKGFSSEQASSAIDRLVAEGALDERRYTRAFIDSRLRKAPEGRSLLARRLQDKGVPRQIVDEILSEIFSDETFEAELILRAAAKLSRRYADADRLTIELRKKGFSPTAIRRALSNEVCD